jgi:hypothetical protein
VAQDVGPGTSAELYSDLRVHLARDIALETACLDGAGGGSCLTQNRVPSRTDALSARCSGGSLPQVLIEPVPPARSRCGTEPVLCVPGVGQLQPSADVSMVIFGYWRGAELARLPVRGC